MTIFSTLHKFSTEHFSGPLALWFDENTRDLVISSLKTGRLPRHVAFIMDGNRRYATEQGKVFSYGHKAGALSLLQIVESSVKLGISHLSMYAFSLENFNRSPEEVSILFQLLMISLNKFLNESDEYKQSARIRVIGNRTYIPADTLEKLEAIEKLTSGNRDITLNLCFAYTSRDEIAHAMQTKVESAESGAIKAKLITTKELEKGFYYPQDTPPLDMLIRTSGHTRFSDFMLWQLSSNCDVVFVPTYWPAFSVFHYYYQLLKYGFRREVEDKWRSWSTIHLFEKNYAFFPSTKTVDLKKLPAPPPLVTITGELSASTQ